MVEPASLAKNYDLLQDKLLARSGNYISTVVAGEPARSSARTA